jgi:type 1 glutamine amidotransferase
MFSRIVFALLIAIGPCTVIWAEEPGPANGVGALSLAKPAKRISVLVVTGGHPFPVQPFRNLFGGYSNMDCTFVDETVGGEAYDDISHWRYDSIVLYNHMKNLSEKRQANFLQLLDRGVGLVILHHAIYGYRPWPEFQKIVGVTSWLSDYKLDVDFKVHIEDPQHPITLGLKDFLIHDETYQGYGLAPNVHVLLSTNEPTNVKAIAWTHTYRKSPVCFFQLGHDANAYSNEMFRRVLGRAISWSAGKRSSAESTSSTEARPDGSSN